MNYYGDGYWGIRQASNGYFGKEPIDLSIAQAALLAGIPNAPSAYQLSQASWRLLLKDKNKEGREKQLSAYPFLFIGGNIYNQLIRKRFYGRTFS